MQDFIVSASWAATAGCFLTMGMLMAMVTAGAAMWVTVRMYYWLKVQVGKMQFESDREIERLESDREIERQRFEYESLRK